MPAVVRLRGDVAVAVAVALNDHVNDHVVVNVSDYAHVNDNAHILIMETVSAAARSAP